MANKNFKISTSKEAYEVNSRAIVVSLTLRNKVQDHYLRSLVELDETSSIVDALDELKGNDEIGDIVLISNGAFSDNKAVVGVTLPNRVQDKECNGLFLCIYTAIDYCYSVLNIKDISLPLLGSESQGYSENDAIETTHNAFDIISDFKKGIKVTLCYKPSTSSITNSSSKAIIRPATNFVDMSTFKIDSYYSYFITYIEQRLRLGFSIPRISDKNDFDFVMAEYGIAPAQLSTWKGPQKKKDAKSKKDVYYPKPGKKALMRIVSILDMSFEEAKDAFFFCGYGLNQFDPIENEWIEYLKLEERGPIREFSSYLVRKYGQKANLLSNEDESL